MPIQIGAKPESSFADPIGLLTDCHRRIERFLNVLVQASALLHGGTLMEEDRKSVETALTYFREAAPKHTADEEETLFPRMRRMQSEEVRRVLARVDGLESDHGRADQMHGEVDRLGRLWLESGVLTPEDARIFDGLLNDLCELYRAHIAIEEGEVFPAAARTLNDDERRAAGAEMQKRREKKAACEHAARPPLL